MEKQPPKKKSRSGSEEREKTKIIGFRVSPVEDAEIKTAANVLGLTVGSYVRDKVLKVVTTKATRRPPLDIVKLNQILAALNREGNNLNQIARRINQTGKAVKISPAGEEKLLTAIKNLEILKKAIFNEIRRPHHDCKGQVQEQPRATGGLSPETREK